MILKVSGNETDPMSIQADLSNFVTYSPVGSTIMGPDGPMAVSFSGSIAASAFNGSVALPNAAGITGFISGDFVRTSAGGDATNVLGIYGFEYSETNLRNAFLGYFGLDAEPVQN